MRNRWLDGRLGKLPAPSTSVVLRVLISRASLSQTVDAINAAYLYGRTLAAAERGQAARWIAARQGLDGAYGVHSLAFPPECSKGIVLFTGERIASGIRTPTSLARRLHVC